MPYIIQKSPKGGYDVCLKSTGKKVAHSDSHAGAKGYIWHAEQGEKKSAKKGKH